MPLFGEAYTAPLKNCLKDRVLSVLATVKTGGYFFVYQDYDTSSPSVIIYDNM